MDYKSEIPLAYQGIKDESSVLQTENGQVVIFDLFHLEKNNGIGFWQRYRENSWLKKQVKEARELLMFSDITKLKLESLYHLSRNKTRLIKPFVSSEVKPFDDDAKDIVRYKYAEGNAYFLFNGPIHASSNVIELLKGFSVFKKKLGSNMKLLLTGTTGKFSDPFMQALDTYKFRNDIVITGYLDNEERMEIFSSAYALVHTNRWERFGMPIPLAMKAGVAILAPVNSVHSEMAGMAGMFFDEKESADIGEKLTRIYRDEQIRSEMIGTGLAKMNNV